MTYVLRTAFVAAAIWLAAILLYTSAGLMFPASGPVAVVFGFAFLVGMVGIGFAVEKKR